MTGPIENKVSELRKSRGLRAAELAQQIGVTRQTVYAIEAGSYVPNTEVALKIARALEVSVEDLFQLAGDGPAREDDIIPAEYLSARRPVKGQPVRAGRVGDAWVSVPVSATPFFLPEADGVIAEGRGKSGRSEVRMFSRDASAKRLVVAGCDPAASLLSHMLERIGGVEIVHAPAASQLALDWLKAGHAHLAGSHLEDPKTGQFNLPFIRRQFPRQDIVVVTFAEWEAGLVVASGNPKSIRKAEDLARKNVRLINRETGSGSRALLDSMLRAASIVKSQVRGYNRVAPGHLAAAYAVSAGEADCCVATQAAARAYGLDFIPVHRERYDFALRRETLELPQAQTFLDMLQRAELRRKLETLAGYDTSRTGARVESRGD
jgi:molybdate-binding protein/DNA-binding XRE family transcriptional regulator